MATINFSSDAPSKAGSPGPTFGSVSKPMKLQAGTMDFDSSYPTGGEDISSIFALFNDSNGVSLLEGVVFFLGAAPVTVDTKVITQFPVDYANKKVMLYGEDTTSGIPAQVSNAANASTVTGVRWIAWGTR